MRKPLVRGVLATLGLVLGSMGGFAVHETAAKATGACVYVRLATVSTKVDTNNVCPGTPPSVSQPCPDSIAVHDADPDFVVPYFVAVCVKP